MRIHNKDLGKELGTYLHMRLFVFRREPPSSYGHSRRGGDERGGRGGGGGRGASPDHAVLPYYDQLDGPVREGGSAAAAAVPDLAADFPTLGSQQGGYGHSGGGAAKVWFLFLSILFVSLSLSRRFYNLKPVGALNVRTLVQYQNITASP